jgi:hypothetical protein
MFNPEAVPSVLGNDPPAAPEAGAAGRRDFLRQVAAAGASAAGLALLTPQNAEAAPATQPLVGRYIINHHFALHNMGIETQSGNNFAGRFSDGSRFEGAVLGANILFHRTLLDGSSETYVGHLSTRPAPGGSDLLLAGSFSKEDGGPMAWYATGAVRG